MALADDPFRRIEALRRFRATARPEAGAGELFLRAGDDLARAERSLGAASEAWQRVCPPALVARTSIVSLFRGVLTIGVDSAAVRYEVDRMLRAGGERELTRACRTTVRRVKLVAWSGPDDGQEGERTPR